MGILVFISFPPRLRLHSVFAHIFRAYDFTVALYSYMYFQRRNDLLKDMNREMVSSAIVEGNVTIKSKRQLSQIIDTTLLKCYLQVYTHVHITSLRWVQ